MRQAVSEGGENDYTPQPSRPPGVKLCSRCHYRQQEIDPLHKCTAWDYLLVRHDLKIKQSEATQILCEAQNMKLKSVFIMKLSVYNVTYDKLLYLGEKLV